MKMIQCGSSHTRIAQACDRCRSKKIRCDGLHPCSQCASAGFECQTSDKLSRRAFPRGYTESLEKKVRQLEAEVKTLRELLDTKEEHLDMMSLSPYSPQTWASFSGSHKLGREQEGSIPAGEMPVIQCSSRCSTGQETVGDKIDVFYLGGSSGFPFVGIIVHNKSPLNELIQKFRFLYTRSSKKWPSKS